MRPPVSFDDALAETLDYLESPAALASIEADPYWPKWDTPWWRVLLLVEIGHAHRVPRAVVRALAQALEHHYLHFFPLNLSQVPSGNDVKRQGLCHCALGSMDKLLRACGVPVDREHPWVRAWFSAYQLDDGGWNCDERVYERAQPRSSVVSTLPVLEALLARIDILNEAELHVLDRGAAYLLDRHLVKSISRGFSIGRSEWLAPCFPRFYEYDLLRGLAFVVRWSELRARPLPLTAIADVRGVLDGLTDAGTIAPTRLVTDGEETLRRNDAGEWTSGHPASSFPLLEYAGALRVPNEWLTEEWIHVRSAVERLTRRGLILTTPDRPR